MDAWCRFAENVCSLEFTYLTDRLAAVSRMVKKIQEQVEERHFAGMWQDAMSELLTWTACAVSPPDPSSTHGCIAPSLCWVSSTAGGVDINRRSEENKRFLSTIIDVMIVPTGLDPTGPITEGRLTIRGLLPRVAVELLPDTEKGPLAYVAMCKELDCWLSFARIKFDCLPKFEQPKLVGHDRQFTTAFFLQHCAYLGSGVEKYGAFILERVRGGEYRRIGWADFAIEHWFNAAQDTVTDIV